MRYIAGQKIELEEKDENGNYTIRIAGLMFTGTYEEWKLVVENLSKVVYNLN